MAGTPSKPLNPFRRQEPPTSKPLHSRWGDVAITVPTEGSWSQYNNPHRRGRKGDYGPSYVSEHATRRPHPHPHPHRHRQLPSDTTTNNNNNNDNDSDELSKPPTSKIPPPPTTSPSHRPGNPNAGRKCLSTRRRPVSFNSRPTSSPAEPNETEGKLGQERLSADPRPDFAYKPISQDYPTEIAESQGSQLHRANTASSARFRYIPASARYRDEFGEIPARSPSKGSSSSCSSAGKRASTVSSTSSKRLTTAMVPDAEDIYG